MTVFGYSLDPVTIITLGLVVAGLLVAALIIVVFRGESEERRR